MSPKLRRFLFGLVGVVLALSIIGSYWFQQVKRASYPQIDGTITLTGLDGPVDVYRDANGVPHIYASTEHDLFMAQGFIHAQDRFWQMDFQRHTSAGRLSELLGGNTVDTDIFLRTLGWERVARQELAAIDDETLSTLQAYADGVNAYLAQTSGTDISLEYLFLNLLNAGYEPQPWEPLNTLTWAKAMAWDLRDNMDTEIDRALLLALLTSEQVAELYPPYPEDRPYIVNDLTGFATGTFTPAPAPDAALAAQLAPALQAAQTQARALDSILGSILDESVGSNSWAVAGSRTASGAALLANDPHLTANIPHIWYQVGLHCRPKGPDCGLDMVGFSFPGVPSIIIGHNDRIAWGFTNVGPDVMDLFIEKLNPENPYQYEFEGEWREMDVVTESIVVAGGETIDLEVRLTHHGPLIQDLYGLDTFSEDAGIDLPENYGLALSWTALQPNRTWNAVFGFAHAQNFEEFRAAARDFAVPSQNLLYADVDGNIGYQMPGLIPLRGGGADGRMPVPGWTGEFEWEGFIPFEQLPWVYNPPEGYIVTANNAVVDEAAYGIQIADTWSYGSRAQRILDLILNAPGPIDVAFFQQMQGDTYYLNAETLMPVLAAVPLENDELTALRDSVLGGWDYRFEQDSPGAALFAAFWKHLLRETYVDNLPEDWFPGGSDRWSTAVSNMLDDESNFWWDDAGTPERETRDDIFNRAFAAAVAELKDVQGNDPTGWTWGGLHGITFRHQVMNNFPLINSVFNEGPFPTSGGSDMVNNTNWNTGNDHYGVSGSSPSFRMIVDLGNLNNSWFIQPTGQSGHAGHPHYIDLAPLWAQVEFLPLHWDLTTIQDESEGHLQLVP
ncbi:MAG: penicillin acylase family protein [Anaerolineae bacterium]|nr:MAG: penicillin acylase family protein [Anaerolineae bacterium]